MQGGGALTQAGNEHTGRAWWSGCLTCERRTGLAWFRWRHSNAPASKRDHYDGFYPRHRNDDQGIAWFGFRMENDMEWLAQNWIFVVGAIGLFLLMRRGGMGCGHGGGGQHGSGRHRRPATHDAHHGEHRAHIEGESPAGPSAPIADPVSGQSVDPAIAVASVHLGAPVYFESRANRDRFEASPEDFPVPQSATPDAHHHRRGGR